MEIMKEGHRMVNGHHVIPLPFIGGRQETVKVLPSEASEAIARQRTLRQGERWSKLGRQDFKMIKTQVEGYLEKGYARKVLPEEMEQLASVPVYTIPIMGVKNLNKSRKVRLCYKAKTVANEVSLKSVLHQGLDLANNLVGCLVRFRQDPVVLLADIEAHFHQECQKRMCMHSDSFFGKMEIWQKR
jgi:hypothetical protein